MCEACQIQRGGVWGFWLISSMCCTSSFEVKEVISALAIQGANSFSSDDQA